MIDVYPYLKKINNHWKEMVTDKHYKSYKNFIEINQLSGIHIDFYHRPYEFLQKKSPELTFRNKILKIMIKINNLINKNILIPKEIFIAINDQCKIILSNDDYWIRFGFTETQLNHIKETYNLLIKFNNEYILKWADSSIKYKCSGVGKTIEGEKFYEFCLKYCTGFKNITPNQLQQFALLRLVHLSDKIKELYKFGIDDAIKYYKSKQQFYKSESDMFGDMKYNLEKLKEISKLYFGSQINVPKPSKITVRPMPELKSMFGSDSRTFNNVLFINTNYWKQYDKNTILRMLLSEFMPGHMTERNNTSNILEGIKLKYKKYIKRGVPICKEGWMSFCEKTMKHIYKYENDLFVLLQEINDTLKIVIDTGLNSNTVDIKFTLTEAKEFMKKFSLNSDEQIENEILICLAKPAYNCTYDLGYYCINNIYATSKLSLKKFNKMFVSIPLNLQLYEELVKHIKS